MSSGMAGDSTRARRLLIEIYDCSCRRHGPQFATWPSRPSACCDVAIESMKGLINCCAAEQFKILMFNYLKPRTDRYRISDFFKSVRARARRDLTVPTETPNTSAISL